MLRIMTTTVYHATFSEEIVVVQEESLVVYYGWKEIQIECRGDEEGAGMTKCEGEEGV